MLQNKAMPRTLLYAPEFATQYDLGGIYYHTDARYPDTGVNLSTFRRQYPVFAERFREHVAWLARGRNALLVIEVEEPMVRDEEAYSVITRRSRMEKVNVFTLLVAQVQDHTAGSDWRCDLGDARPDCTVFYKYAYTGTEHGGYSPNQLPVDQGEIWDMLASWDATFDEGQCPDR